MTDLAVYVCGSAGTHPGPGRACSGYLVESAGTRLLLDCGNGSLTNLQHRCDVADLDAVVLSHLHPDHFGDLYGLYYALRFHPTGQRQVDVYAPAGAEAFIRQLLSSDSTETFGQVLRFHAVAAGDVLEIGGLRARLYAAYHPIETLATRVETLGGVVAFSGDSALTPTLVPCAREADLFLCDSSWVETMRPLPEGVHMTGAEAGRTAAEAAAAKLVVTHVVPTVDVHAVAAEAAEAFGGEIVIAEDGKELQP